MYVVKARRGPSKNDTDVLVRKSDPDPDADSDPVQLFWIRIHFQSGQKGPDPTGFGSHCTTLTHKARQLVSISCKKRNISLQAGPNLQLTGISSANPLMGLSL
jgi:hypothetical protein